MSSFLQALSVVRVMEGNCVRGKMSISAGDEKKIWKSADILTRCSSRPQRESEN